MANKVSYIIQLQDRFSAVARKIKRSLGSIDNSAKKLSTRLVKLQATTRAAAKGLAKMGAVATATATVPILLLGRAMINAASDATETASKFDQVFDDVGDKANQVAKDFTKNFGVASSTAKKLIGDTGDLLVGFGFTGDAALKLAKEVNELAADLASFQNLEGGTERASQALTKALLGETESAKSLGIVIRQNDPAFKATVKSLQRSLRVTEQQAKAITILRVATLQSQKAIGDVNRTWADYANVIRRSEEKTKELRESFGKLLLPAATKIVAAITELIEGISNLSPGMKKIILVVVGLVAVVGPLLLLLAGVAFAFSVISAPILIVVAAVGALIAGFVLFKDKFVGLGELLKAEFEKVLVIIDILLKPLKAVGDLLGFIADKIFGLGRNEINVEVSQRFRQQQRSIESTPSTPVTSTRTQTDVNVNLRAPERTVESIKTRTRGRLPGLNVGVNMETVG